MSNGIGSFCTRQVITVAADATIVEATRLMRQHHAGAVVMVDDRGGARKPLGVLTDRDVAMEVVALGVSPETLKVSEVPRLDRSQWAISTGTGIACSTVLVMPPSTSSRNRE